MAQLLRRETCCSKRPRSGSTDLGSIPGQSKIMNVPIYHEVNMTLKALFSNVQRIIIMHEMNFFPWI